MLLHYNGHGVPPPTANGEVWFFAKKFTHYIPVPIDTVRSWLQDPGIYIFDCMNSAVLIRYLDGPPHYQIQDLPPEAVQETNSSNPEQYPHHYIPPPHFSPVDDQGKPLPCKPIPKPIILCACLEGESLPQHPAFGADIFTSCLTQPIPMALKWYCHCHRSLYGDSLIDLIAQDLPGTYNDRRTPLGELNWVFTAVTDTIAWNALPSSVFHFLFREDLLVATLYRNFIFANRVIRALGATPVSHPAIPNTATHPLWDAWDHAVEIILSNEMRNAVSLRGVSTLSSLPYSISPTTSSSSPQPFLSSSSSSYNQRLHNTIMRGDKDGSMSLHKISLSIHSSVVSPIPQQQLASSFFVDYLTTVELWLDSYHPHLPSEEDFFTLHKEGEDGRGTNNLTQSPFHPFSSTNEHTKLLPEAAYLPIILQVLLNQTFRHRALKLLSRFLATDRRGVHLSLLVGIFPYIQKLLISPSHEIVELLIPIWARIIAFDPSVKKDLLKERRLIFPFINYLSSQSASSNPSNEMTLVMCSFSMCEIMNKYNQGQVACIEKGLHRAIAEAISQTPPSLSLINQWICLCLAKLVDGYHWGQLLCKEVNLINELYDFFSAEDPNVRGAAIYALSCFIQREQRQEEYQNSSSLKRNRSGGSMLSSPSRRGHHSSDRIVDDPGKKRKGSDDTVNENEEFSIRDAEVNMIFPLLEMFYDASPLVRREAVYAIILFVTSPIHLPVFVHLLVLITQFSSSLTPSPTSVSPKNTSNDAYLVGNVNSDRSTTDSTSIPSSSASTPPISSFTPPGPMMVNLTTHLALALQIPVTSALPHQYIRIWQAIRDLGAKEPHSMVYRLTRILIAFVKNKSSPFLHSTSPEIISEGKSHRGDHLTSGPSSCPQVPIYSSKELKSESLREGDITKNSLPSSFSKLSSPSKLHGSYPTVDDPEVVSEHSPLGNEMKLSSNQSNDELEDELDVSIHLSDDIAPSIDMNSGEMKVEGNISTINEEDISTPVRIFDLYFKEGDSFQPPIISNLYQLFKKVSSLKTYL